jgi:hypothetical protein
MQENHYDFAYGEISCNFPVFELTAPIEMLDKNILRNLRLAHFGSPPVDEKIDT